MIGGHASRPRTGGPLNRSIAVALASVLVIALAALAVILIRDDSGTARPRTATPRSSATQSAPATSTPTATPDPPPTGTAQPGGTSTPPASVSAPTATPEPVAVLVGAGDIADCASAGDEATAALLDAIGGTVFTLGDNVYPAGTPDQFAGCYAPSWGRHVSRTFPSAGNHDYETPGAAGYYGYFGPAAGQPGQGWYSYNAGAWHVVVLNSVCGAVGGCHAGSAQEVWLRADLAANRAPCTLAYWHHPRFSSGEHGSDPTYDAFWRALYDAGAEVVLVGHDHVYERFAPQTPDAAADPARGVRQFTVGTGGKSLYAFGPPIANSEARSNQTFGVLELTVRASGYDWRFVPVVGGAFTDSGTGTCH